MRSEFESKICFSKWSMKRSAMRGADGDPFGFAITELVDHAIEFVNVRKKALLSKPMNSSSTSPWTWDCANISLTRSVYCSNEKMERNFSWLKNKDHLSCLPVIRSEILHISKGRLGILLNLTAYMYIGGARNFSKPYCLYIGESSEFFQILSTCVCGEEIWTFPFGITTYHNVKIKNLIICILSWLAASSAICSLDGDIRTK